MHKHSVNTSTLQHKQTKGRPLSLLHGSKADLIVALIRSSPPIPVLCSATPESHQLQLLNTDGGGHLVWNTDDWGLAGAIRTPDDGCPA